MVSKMMSHRTDTSRAEGQRQRNPAHREIWFAVDCNSESEEYPVKNIR